MSELLPILFCPALFPAVVFILCMPFICIYEYFHPTEHEDDEYRNRKNKITRDELGYYRGENNEILDNRKCQNLIKN